MNNSIEYDPIQISKRYVYGTDNPELANDYNEHIRPQNTTPQAIEYSMMNYMEDGGGRFAYPSLFPVIERFFDIPESTLQPGNYNESAIKNVLFTPDPNLSGPGAAQDQVDEEFENGKRVTVSQYGTGVFSSDHPERAYIFGTTGFYAQSF